jgi:hypothetical protein
MAEFGICHAKLCRQPRDHTGLTNDFSRDITPGRPMKLAGFRCPISLPDFAAEFH